MRFSFDIEPLPTQDASRPRWEGRRRHGSGVSRFELVLDFGEAVCRFERVPDGASGAPIDLPYRLLGNSMSLRGDEAGDGSPFTPHPPGDWVLLQLHLPVDGGTFQVGMNPRLGVGQIWIAEGGAGATAAVSLLEPIVGPTKPATETGATAGGHPARGAASAEPAVDGSPDRSRSVLGEATVRSGRWLPDLDDAFDLIDFGE